MVPELARVAGLSVVFAKKILNYSLLEAHGSFVIDPDHLHIQADVKLVNGLLGEGSVRERYQAAPA